MTIIRPPLMLLVLALLPFWAQAENLVDVYRLAVAEDADLRAAGFRLEANREALPQSRAGLRPNVNFAASLNESDADNFTRESYSLNLTQPLYRKQNWNAVDQAAAGIAQAEAEYLASQQGLMLQVTERYLDVLGAIDDLDFANAELEATSRQLDQAQKRFEVGLIAITDVREAEAARDLAEAQRILAENQVANARQALQVLTNAYHTQLAPLREELPLLRPDPQDINAWVQTAEAQNPLLQAAGHAVEAAREALRVARGGHHPTLDLVASYQHAESEGLSLAADDSTTLSLQFNLPIYSGGLTSAQVRQSLASFHASQQELERQRRSVDQQTRDAYRGVLSGIGRVRALKQALTSTQTAAEATQAGFEVGTRTAVDVLLALRETFRAERDYHRARYDYLLNSLRLKQAAGTLQQDDLAAINAWLR